MTPKRVDGNQSQIVGELRGVPAVSVFCLHEVGKDFPDIIVGFRGVNTLWEIKTDKGKLTSGQTEWHETWRGQVGIARDSTHILKCIGAIG